MIDQDAWISWKDLYQEQDTAAYVILSRFNNPFLPTTRQQHGFPSNFVGRTPLSQPCLPPRLQASPMLSKSWIGKVDFHDWHLLGEAVCHPMRKAYIGCLFATKSMVLYGLSLWNRGPTFLSHPEKLGSSVQRLQVEIGLLYCQNGTSCHYFMLDGTNRCAQYGTLSMAKIDSNEYITLYPSNTPRTFDWKWQVYAHSPNSDPRPKGVCTPINIRVSCTN